MREITAPQKCGFFVFVTTTVTLRPSPIDEFDVVVHALSAQTQEVESPPKRCARLRRYPIAQCAMAYRNPRMESDNLVEGKFARNGGWNVVFH
jgi:hypothetical protein